ncbi:MAG: hypothetical protein ACOCWG_04860 [bacterium]
MVRLEQGEDLRLYYDDRDKYDLQGPAIVPGTEGDSYYMDGFNYYENHANNLLLNQ